MFSVLSDYFRTTYSWRRINICYVMRRYELMKKHLRRRTKLKYRPSWANIEVIHFMGPIECCGTNFVISYCWFILNLSKLYRNKFITLYYLII